MSTKPMRPDGNPQVSEEEKNIILERLATYEKDKLTSVDARESLAQMHRDLKPKHLAPR